MSRTTPSRASNRGAGLSRSYARARPRTPTPRGDSRQGAASGHHDSTRLRLRPQSESDSTRLHITHNPTTTSNRAGRSPNIPQGMKTAEGNFTAEQHDMQNAKADNGRKYVM